MLSHSNNGESEKGEPALGLGTDHARQSSFKTNTRFGSRLVSSEAFGSGGLLPRYLAQAAAQELGELHRTPQLAAVVGLLLQTSE